MVLGSCTEHSRKSPILKMPGNTLQSTNAIARRQGSGICIWGKHLAGKVGHGKRGGVCSHRTGSGRAMASGTRNPPYNTTGEVCNHETQSNRWRVSAEEEEDAKGQGAGNGGRAKEKTPASLSGVARGKGGSWRMAMDGE